MEIISGIHFGLFTMAGYNRAAVSAQDSVISFGGGIFDTAYQYSNTKRLQSLLRHSRDICLISFHCLKPNNGTQILHEIFAIFQATRDKTIDCNLSFQSKADTLHKPLFLFFHVQISSYVLNVVVLMIRSGTERTMYQIKDESFYWQFNSHRLIAFNTIQNTHIYICAYNLSCNFQVQNHCDKIYCM